MRLLSKLLRFALRTLVTLALVAAVGWWLSRPDEPGPFYVSSVDPVPPGRLIRTEPFLLEVPAGASAWRILYATTRLDGRPALASAVVMVSSAPAAAPRPAIAWAHGTTGIVPGCAPSVMAPFANVPALRELLAEGWVYIATDYAGLGTEGGHAYLVGREAAHSVLDSVKAAQQMREVALDGRTVVWGHSQGGNSALWTGLTAAAYAPDLQILGVAAVAPASDLPALLRAAQKNIFGKIVSSFLLSSYAATYEDVEPSAYVRPLTRRLARDIASRCAGGMGALFSVAETALLPAGGIFAADPTKGPLGQRLTENTPTGSYPMPVLIAQGETDDLVLEAIQWRYAKRLCDAGDKIEYRSFDGRDHLSVVAPDSPLTAQLINWTKFRLAGLAPVETCRFDR